MAKYKAGQTRDDQIKAEYNDVCLSKMRPDTWARRVILKHHLLSVCKVSIGEPSGTCAKYAKIRHASSIKFPLGECHFPVGKCKYAIPTSGDEEWQRREVVTSTESMVKT